MDRKPQIVDKPWGREIIYASIPGKYLGKILEINKGCRLSRQYHSKKYETIYVLEGHCLMELDGKEYIYEEGESAVIPTGLIHRFSAPEGNVKLLEVSTYFPDDTIRISDDYARK